MGGKWILDWEAIAIMLLDGVAVAGIAYLLGDRSLRDYLITVIRRGVWKPRQAVGTIAGRRLIERPPRGGLFICSRPLNC
jgi:hypothetical protein